ncbi:hypothetical protein BOX15_Mlig023790g1 [Macrostomum lignano]|uniref:Signal transducing adapter molecule 1 n=2 Tax=Macrostomum lignano TaxID=282301 RepID=A0A267ETF1_9PLAT|nr:hypothetical protein BOX15_Mlig023790g1 [Macrostomum lignano]
MSHSKIEQEIDKCTDEKNTKDDWNQIYECVDLINASRRQKDVLKILLRKLRNRNPHVSMQALTLLDSCVANCGHEFHRELCSKSFCSDAKSILNNKSINPQVLQRFAYLLRKWSQMNEIRNDSSLGLLGDLVSDLRAMGFTFDYENKTSGNLEAAASKSKSSASSGGVGSSGGGRSGSASQKDSSAAALSKEDEDLAKAIALSLQEQQQQQQRSASPRLGGGASGGGGSGGAGGLYPNMMPAADAPSGAYLLNSAGPPSSAPPPPVLKRVRALYDFEAAEDNELTFHTGDVILVDDCSDPNWWHGSTLSGGMVGLFPSTFVEDDTGPKSEEPGKGVSFNDQVSVKLIEEPVTIDPAQIDECLAQLENCDPTGDPNRPDPAELPHLEERCRQMAPLIDSEIEQLDRKYLELHQLNTRLAEAFQMYHNLMSASAPPPPPPPPPQAQQQQQMYYPVVSSAAPDGFSGGAYGQPQPPVSSTGVVYSNFDQQQQQHAAYLQLQQHMMQQQQPPQQPPPQQQQQQQMPPHGGYNQHNQHMEPQYQQQPPPPTQPQYQQQLL